MAGSHERVSPPSKLGVAFRNVHTHRRAMRPDGFGEHSKVLRGHSAASPFATHFEILYLQPRAAVAAAPAHYRHKSRVR
jgi:hypothetical protein